jgi:hypothetical protein
LSRPWWEKPKDRGEPSSAFFFAEGSGGPPLENHQFGIYSLKSPWKWFKIGKKAFKEELNIQ